MKTLSQKIAEVWGNMDERSRYRCVMLLARRAELQPAVRYLRPIFKFSLAGCCRVCGGPVDHNIIPRQDQTFDPILPDLVEQKKRRR